MSTTSVQVLGLKGDPRPPDGQRAIGPFVYKFVNATPIVTNLTAEMSNHALISFAQSMYVDNSQNPNPIHIQFGIQSINILAHVQGWLPVISQRPIIFSIDCPLASGTTSIVITNYPVAPFLYLTQ